MTETKQAVWQINSIRTGPRGGTPVVLVHPAGLDLTYWDAQIEALCDSYDTVAFDLPGHGRSPGTPADWTLDNAALMLAQVIRSTGSDAAHVVALSVGSVIAQSLVVTQPDLVRSLVLMGAAPVFSEAGRNAMMQRSKDLNERGMQAVIAAALERWFTDATIARRPDIIDRVIKTLTADDPLVHAALWDMMYHFDVRATLSGVACPTLIITGELDPSTPPSASEAIHDLISGSEIEILPGVSHMVMLEAPDRINELLLRFLAKSSAL